MQEHGMVFGVQQHSRWFLLPLILIALIFSGCSLSAPVGGGDAQTTFDGAPVVRIFSPLPNQTFLEGTTVNIQARIENAGPDIAKVSIFLDDALAGEQPNPNQSGAAAFSVTLDWVTSNPGQYEIAVVAERADGTSSNRETVKISVIKQATVGGDSGEDTSNTDNTTSQPTATSADTASSQSSDNNTNTGNSSNTNNSGTSGNSNTTTQPTPAPPTNTPQPSNTPEPTDSPTPSKPMALVISGANLRRGPSTVFEPPVGSIAANQEAEIVAVNPGRDWYKIKYFNSEAWIFGTLIETSGDVASLPVDAGPPTPLPPTATPLPTATPVPSPINLYVVNIQIAPHPLVCNESSEIQVTVGNNGTQGSGSGGKIRVEAILETTGAVLETTETIFGAIEAGKQQTASAFITVSTNFAEPQFIRVTVDSENQIDESNESDNVSEGNTRYILEKGNCG